LGEGVTADRGNAKRVSPEKSARSEGLSFSQTTAVHLPEKIGKFHLKNKIIFIAYAGVTARAISEMGMRNLSREKHAGGDGNPPDIGERYWLQRLDNRFGKRLNR
jgi:hypothetical protein